jgi:virulence factor Mce-like protein
MANPVLVGATTTLVVVVAVFLAYNASRGLPFIPTNGLRFQVSNGANLLPGNEVREGGYRVGIVDAMKPVRLPDGTTGAEVTLKIDKKVDAYPRDSTINLRPRSVLGLKYVEIKRGRDNRTFASGAMVPADQATFPVELDQLYNIFDEKTRDASRETLKGVGNAFASRGASLNQTIADAPRFLRHLEPVAKTLADDDTQLGALLQGARRRDPDHLAGRRPLRALLRGRRQHLRGVVAVPDRLQATIEKSAPTMRTGVTSFRNQRPLPARVPRLLASLERAAATLPATLPRITPALQRARGHRALGRDQHRARAHADQPRGAHGRPEDRARAARRHRASPASSTRSCASSGPYVTVCNYFNYSATNLGEHVTEPDTTGTSQRTLLNQASRPAIPRARASARSARASRPTARRRSAASR